MMWFIFVFLSLAVVLWLYARISCGRCVCPRDRISGKTVVITGGNGGIGKCVSAELAKAGANLIIGCRNTMKAENLKAEWAKKGYKGTVHVLYLNLMSFASVRSFAEGVAKISPTVDVLVNNAGMAPHDFKKTEDNFESAYQTNYLSAFLLTHLLLPIIKRDGGRIVNVSSVLHILGSERRLAKNEFATENDFNYRSRIYCDSKLAIAYWTKTLATKLAGTGITVNCCHPGYVHTDIFSSEKGFFMLAVLRLFAHIYAKTPEEGADPILHLILSEDASLITGKYWADCVAVKYSRRPLRRKIAEIVWKNTLSHCKVEDI